MRREDTLNEHNEDILSQDGKTYRAVYNPPKALNQVHHQILQIYPNFSKKQERQISMFERIKQQAITRAKARQRVLNERSS